MGGGFWITMRFSEVEADEGRPHGLMYAVSLHGPSDDRIIGYDNAHRPDVFSGPSGRARQRELAFDHRHVRGKVTVYNFTTPLQLLSDFWDDVERILAEARIP